MKFSLAKILLALVGLALFIAINFSAGPHKSALQASYESWLSAIQTSTALPSNVDYRVPSIKITFDSSYPDRQTNWVLISSGDEDTQRKVLRLLQLAREASFFSSPLHGKVADSSNSLILSVEEGSHKFSSRFLKEFLDENVAAQSFVKLFQFYHEQGSKTTATISQQ